jgi:hypothetical protein
VTGFGEHRDSSRRGLPVMRLGGGARYVLRLAPRRVAIAGRDVTRVAGTRHERPTTGWRVANRPRTAVPSWLPLHRGEPMARPTGGRRQAARLANAACSGLPLRCQAEHGRSCAAASRPIPCVLSELAEQRASGHGPSVLDMAA